MSDIFEEVEESLRKDNATVLWKRYGPFVWAVGLLIIGAVAYREYSLIQDAAKAEVRIEAFEAARAELEDGDYASAQAGFAELVQGGSDISPLAAQFLARSYYEGNGDISGAVDVLEAASDSEGPLERLSLLKAAYLQADTMSLTELETFLGDLPKEPTALGALALELVAAKAFKEGDVERAQREFSYLRFASDAPPGVVQRAEVALSVLPAASVPTEEAGDAPAAIETPQDETIVPTTPVQEDQE